MSNEGGPGEQGLALPGEPPPVLLMNTIWADRQGVHDDLARRSGLARWLEVSGLGAGARVTERHLERARAMRDSLRCLAAALTGDDRPPAIAGGRSAADLAAAARIVNEAAAAAPLGARIVVRRGEVCRETTPAATTVPDLLAALAVSAIDLLSGGGRLRACHAPGCVLYFVKDHPRREWCSTSCGNRARAARHYRRHHGGRQETADPAE